MKELKIAAIGLAILLAGCQNNDFYYPEEDYLEPIKNERVNDGAVEATVIPAQTEKPAVTEEEVEDKETAEEFIEDMHPQEPVGRLENDSAYEPFLDNVTIKSRSENHITYEYKKARVDELAPLASRYCEDHGNRTAVLRSVINYQNFARHATFDCLRLQ